MSEDREEGRPESVGPRMMLPCGHRWTLPVGLAPEVVAAELLQHQSVCDLDSGVPIFGRLGSPGSWLVPGDVGP